MASSSQLPDDPMHNRPPPIVLVHCVPGMVVGQPCSEQVVVEPIPDEEALVQHVEELVRGDPLCCSAEVDARTALGLLERMGLGPLTITPPTLERALRLEWPSRSTPAAIRRAATELGWRVLE